MPGLPDDWHAPIRDVIARLWDDNPESERLEALWQERDESGTPKWFQIIEQDPDDVEWSRVMLRPSDPRDTRPAECVGRWPTKYVTDKELDARAIVKEHHTD